MDEDLSAALDTLGEHGQRLRAEYRFDWPQGAQQTVCWLRLTFGVPDLPPIVGVVGGASSGKSTVFDNLLGGHEASRITARGHATRGPVLAVHETCRTKIETLIESRRLFPGLDTATVEIDARTEGDPGRLDVLYHQVESLRNVLLLDTPDFTSEAARQEGDVLWALLPWFDRAVIVVDRERWFDRQSISTLRTESARFSQERLVLFNRTQEGTLSDPELDALRGQADRLAATNMVVLEFRRGRGLCKFPPGTFDDVLGFLAQEKHDRTPGLMRVAADASNDVLNQNEERRARLAELKDALRRAVDRTTPSPRETMTALMTRPEREQMEIVSRVLRVQETKEWLTAQTRRFENALRQVPLVGSLMGRGHDDLELTSDETDRHAIAFSYFRAVAGRQSHEVQRAVKASAFWDELRRWTGLTPGETGFDKSESTPDRLRTQIDDFDAALRRWNARVEQECKGINPNIKGAVGAGVLGIAIVLVAVPGPVAILTLASAKGAVVAALGKLAMASGAGAVFGKHFTRLVSVVQEKLIGSEEFAAVQKSAGVFHTGLQEAGRRLAAEAIGEAEELVLPENDPLHRALERLRAS